MICKICRKKIKRYRDNYMWWDGHEYHPKCWDKMEIDFTNGEKTPHVQCQEYFVKQKIGC